MKVKRLLFFGELPPDAVHGIAIQNQINLDMLKNRCIADIVQDKRTLLEHEKVSFKKIFRLLKSIYSVLKLSIRYRYDFLYLPFSLSIFGGLKTLLVILVFRGTNMGKVFLHIHRGDFFSRFYLKPMNKFIAKTAFLLSTKIIVLSEKQRMEFLTHFRSEFYVLPNTVEKEVLPNFDKRSKKRFIFISNYLEDKGIIDLLEVFSIILNKNSDVNLETFGQFADDKIKKTVMKYAAANISINGIISSDEKFRILSDSDCLVLPSWNEGQPVVILEAMSVGTPVISTYTGLIPEMLGTTYPYLANPSDRKSLEKKILQFLNDDSEEISVRIFENYCSNFSRKSHMKALDQIFEL